MMNVDAIAVEAIVCLYPFSTTKNVSLLVRKAAATPLPLLSSSQMLLQSQLPESTLDLVLKVVFFESPPSFLSLCFPAINSASNAFLTSSLDC